MKKIISVALAFFSLLSISSATVFAGPEPCDGPEDVGSCVNGRECVEVVIPTGPTYYDNTGPECGSGIGGGIIGEVNPPQNIQILNILSGGGTDGIGLLYFANRVILLITIVAGIIVMLNFIKAGWMYLTAGDSTKVASEVKDVLTYSVIGLVIIAVSYTIAGLIGLLFFGDAGFILNPELYRAIDVH